jgi:hypothetical protein
VSRLRIPVPVVGLAVPAVISLAAVTTAFVVAPARDIAVHWGPDGTADGWAPAWTVVVGMAVLGVIDALAFGLPLFATRREGPSAFQKLIAAIAVAFGVLMAALGLWVLLSQLDAAAEPPTIGVGLPLSVVIALVSGVLAWFATPRPMPVDPKGVAAEPLALAPGERAVWIGRTRLAWPGLVAVVVAIVASLGAAVAANVTTEGRVGALFLVPVVLLAVLVLTSFWVVRVDDDGLDVHSPLGWPRFRMPAAEVASAGTVEVSAVGEFGGWGIRSGKGRRLGIVMRSGHALEAQNRDGRALVVTVDDAGTAAALLSAVAARATAERG